MTRSQSSASSSRSSGDGTRGPRRGSSKAADSASDSGALAEAPFGDALDDEPTGRRTASKAKTAKRGSSSDAEESASGGTRRKRTRRSRSRKSEEGTDDGKSGSAEDSRAGGDAPSDDAPDKKESKPAAKKRRSRKKRGSTKSTTDSAEESAGEDLLTREERNALAEAATGREDGEDAAQDDSRGEKKSSRRRRSTSRRKKTTSSKDEEETQEPTEEPERSEEDSGEGKTTKRRRRGTRGGRNRSRKKAGAPVAVDVIPGEEDDLPELPELPEEASLTEEGESKTRSKRKRKSRSRSGSDETATRKRGGRGSRSDDDEADAESGSKKKRRSRKRGKAGSAEEGGADEDRQPEEVERNSLILVNSHDHEEQRVAVVRDGRIVDFDMTVDTKVSHVGDIYRGRVVNLEPAIGAAFVDFGRGRNGFLHTSDVLSAYGDKDWKLSKLLTTRVDPDEWGEDGESDEPADEGSKKKGSSRKRGRKGKDDDKEDSESSSSDGRGKRGKGRSTSKYRARPRLPITDLLKKGQQVCVQVTKDAIGDKGPTLTTYLSIPGRYLVLMPSMARRGVSRKIEDEKERRRLKRIVDSLKAPDDMGVIVRTAGVGRLKTELKRDLEYLLGLWEGFGKRLRQGSGTSALYVESDVAIRTIRDLYSHETEAVIVDDKHVHGSLIEFAEELMPDAVPRIRLHDGARPLFHTHGVEQDFEKIFSRRVELPSGGSIVLDQTEALVAIDVNSGRTRTDGFDFEAIALKTNLEAVPEIARQIRLRDLGGILVLDFIDMMKRSNMQKVERAFRAELAKDRARSKIGRISQFGLLEMTRQRLGPGLDKKVFTTCPRCRGTARVRTIESRAAAILRRLGSAMTLKGFTKVEVRAHPEVVEFLETSGKGGIEELKVRFAREIELTPVPDQPEDSVLRYLRADGREVRPGGRRKR